MPGQSIQTITEIRDLLEFNIPVCGISDNTMDGLEDGRGVARFGCTILKVHLIVPGHIDLRGRGDLSHNGRTGRILVDLGLDKGLLVSGSVMLSVVQREERAITHGPPMTEVKLVLFDAA